MERPYYIKGGELCQKEFWRLVLLTDWPDKVTMSTYLPLAKITPENHSLGS